MDPGAVQATTDLALAFEVAVTAVGAPGTAAGMADADAADEGPVPAELVADTMNVYGDPLVRPPTMQLVADVEHVNPPGLDTTV